MVQYKYKQKHKQTASHRARVEIVHHILAAVSRYPGDGIPRYRSNAKQALAQYSCMNTCTLW
jgi:hypothetical protein